jgi:hypothetical protein
MGVLLLLAASGSSCVSDVDDNYQYGIAPVDSVRVLSATSPQVEFLVYGTFPVPCWEHTGPVVVEEGTHRYAVSLGARIRTDLACIQVIGPYEKGVTVDVPGPGDYEFLFPRGAVDTLIVMAHVE